MSLDGYLMTGIHHDTVIQTRMCSLPWRLSMVHLIIPPHHPLGTTELFLCVQSYAFRECYKAGILPHVAFSDKFLSPNSKSFKKYFLQLIFCCLQSKFSEDNFFLWNYTPRFGGRLCQKNIPLTINRKKKKKKQTAVNKIWSLKDIRWPQKQQRADGLKFQSETAIRTKTTIIRGVVVFFFSSFANSGCFDWGEEFCRNKEK